jgi:hypothetical protein
MYSNEGNLINRKSIEVFHNMKILARVIIRNICHLFPVDCLWVTSKTEFHNVASE